MRLYIGKNHVEKETTSVKSIFRLAGSNEDALTYALGYMLAYDYDFCAQLIRILRFASQHTLKLGYSVYLQEVTDSAFGRRDIVIEDSKMRIVLEAKIGTAEPTEEQLLKYSTESDLWGKYEVRGIVALTQVELPATTTKKFASNCRKMEYSSITCNGTKSLTSRSSTGIPSILNWHAIFLMNLSVT